MPRHTPHLRPVTFSLLLTCLLAGCATLSKDECLHGDWRTVGYEDGAAGTPRTRIGEHQESCAEYGVTPDFDSYQRGYDQGLSLFCTHSNGYSQGVSGRAAMGICPPPLDEEFLRGYQLGREAAQLQNTRRNLAAELERIERLSDAISQEIAAKKQQLFSDRPSPELRRMLYRDIEDLVEERDLLELRYEKRRRELLQTERHLQRLENQAHDQILN